MDPDGLIAETLESCGFYKTKAQIKRKRSEFIHSYSMVKLHIDLQDGILKRTEDEKDKVRTEANNTHNIC